MRSPLGTLLNKTPVPYAGRQYGTDPANRAAIKRGDTAAQIDAMGGNGTLFSIINKLSTETSAVSWHLHAQAAGSVCELCEETGVRHVERHPALVVWNRPNDFFTRQEFVETFQQHVDLTGEGWWCVAKVGGRPVELWPVRPDRIAPVRHATKFIDGYVYSGPDGEKVPLGTDEVVMLRMPNPADPWRGMGPVQALLYDLYGAQAAAEWNANFFANSALPGGIIEFEAIHSDDEFNLLRDRWAEQHRGVANAHRVAILEGNGKWAERKYTQRDMEFAELRRGSREVIREAFGIHGHVLGLSEDINRANAEAADVTFARRLIVPRAERIKQALNNDFLKLFGATGQGYAFAYANPVPANVELDNATRESKARAVRELVSAGFHPDDAAETCGLPPMRNAGMRELVTAGTGGTNDGS